MSGAEDVGMNVVRHSQRSALLPAHQVLSEAHHYNVHRVASVVRVEVVSNNTWPTASMQCGLHAEYGDVHSQHLENECWTKNWVSCASIVLFFNLTSAEMVAGLNPMLCIPGRVKGSTTNTKCQSDCSGVMWHFQASGVHLSKCVHSWWSKKWWTAMQFLYCIVHLVLYWHLFMWILQFDLKSRHDVNWLVSVLCTTS